jgi:hypothetical protein
VKSTMSPQLLSHYVSAVVKQSYLIHTELLPGAARVSEVCELVFLFAIQTRPVLAGTLLCAHPLPTAHLQPLDTRAT